MLLSPSFRHSALDFWTQLTSSNCTNFSISNFHSSFFVWSSRDSTSVSSFISKASSLPTLPFWYLNYQIHLYSKWKSPPLNLLISYKEQNYVIHGNCSSVVKCALKHRAHSPWGFFSLKRGALTKACLRRAF